MSEVCKVAQLFILMPASNGVRQNCFSIVRNTKDYLRASMKQTHLNSLMILHIYKDKTDKLSLIEVRNDFCSRVKVSVVSGISD